MSELKWNFEDNRQCYVVFVWANRLITNYCRASCCNVKVMKSYIPNGWKGFTLVNYVYIVINDHAICNWSPKDGCVNSAGEIKVIFELCIFLFLYFLIWYTWICINHYYVSINLYSLLISSKHRMFDGFLNIYIISIY